MKIPGTTVTCRFSLFIASAGPGMFHSLEETKVLGRQFLR
jgi:hypothetical protein